MNRLVFCIFIVFIFCGLVSKGENIYPEVGKKCPDFLLHDIRYFHKKKAVLSDFKGKWLILDFWNKSCGACIASFPKVSNLQKQFAKEVQFMLVGIEDKEGQIGPMYDKFRNKEHYAMPCAFDSALANKWDIYMAPYVIVIDPDGNVKAISYIIDAEDIYALMDGKSIRLPKAYRIHEDEPDSLIVLDRNRPFLINGNGGVDSVFLFRSIVSRFDNLKQKAYIPESLAQDSKQGRLQILGAPLFMLYNYAWYGVPYPNRDSGYQIFPILEIQDSTYFKYSDKYSENLFCYSLNIPSSKASKDRLQQMMRRDLENYFSCNANIETRKFPCWELIALGDAREKLATRGEKPGIHFLMPNGEFTVSNWSMKKLIRLLQGYNHNIIVDKSGITENIDIHMDCLLPDVEDVKKALRVNGLDLIPAEKDMKVLVVRNVPQK